MQIDSLIEAKVTAELSYKHSVIVCKQTPSTMAAAQLLIMLALLILQKPQLNKLEMRLLIPFFLFCFR